MQKLLCIYKPVGLTPLKAINKLRVTNPELAETKISYAGRLDPLAHGILLLMMGEETKNRDYYLSLPKRYEFTVCFGLQTDTYDILGLLDIETTTIDPKNVNIFVNNFVKRYLGKHLLNYPPFSSKTVNGKPLFWWAKNNKLSEIEIPTKEIEIFEFKILSVGEIPSSTLEQKVVKEITSVHGEFRQKEILERWNHYFAKQKTGKNSNTVRFSIHCSSGTYIRELTNLMGKELGCGAIAIDILRVAVGNYSLNDTKHIDYGDFEIT